DRLGQGGLARTIRSDQADVLAALQREGRDVEEHALADRHLHVLGLEDRATAPGRLQKLEPELPAAPRQQLDLALRPRLLLLEPPDLRQLGLGLPRHLRRRGAEARHESLETFDVAADTPRSLGGRLEASRLLQPPGV